MPAVVDLCEAVADAINDAALAGEFNFPLTAFVDFAPTLPMESSDELRMQVMPGPSHNSPAGLSLDVMADEVSVRLVLSVRIRPQQVEAVKGYVSLIESVCDQVRQRVPSRNYTYIDADPEDELVYDPDRLRDDGIFYGCMVLSFTSLRTAA